MNKKTCNKKEIAIERCLQQSIMRICQKVNLETDKKKAIAEYIKQALEEEHKVEFCDEFPKENVFKLETFSCQDYTKKFCTLYMCHATITQKEELQDILYIILKKEPKQEMPVKVVPKMSVLS